jgi:hypothetical protein
MCVLKKDLQGKKKKNFIFLKKFFQNCLKMISIAFLNENRPFST